MSIKTKSIYILILAVFLLTAFSGSLAASENHYDVWRQTAERAASEAFQLMGGKPSGMLVLTNAGYAVAGGSTTEACLDGLSSATGCTQGKGTLLDVHSSRDKSLWFFFFDRTSGDSVYCQVNGAIIADILSGKAGPDTMPAGELFAILAKENIAAENLLAQPEAWNKKVTEKVFGGNEFGIVTIANVASKDAPYDFIKATLFHDHLCPGVTSGYLIANYLKKELPLRSADESYFIIAIPNWCKDDALQILLNTTPGKSGLAVIPMNDESKETLKPEGKNLAGIYFRWNGKTKKGEGLVLGYDFDKAGALSGIDMSKGFGWATRLKSDIWYLDYLNKPETFINVIKKVELKEGEEPADYAQPGVNPLIKLELVLDKVS